MAENKIGKSQVDFLCAEPDCGGVVKFNLADAGNGRLQAVCPKCHKIYEFDEELLGNLRKLLNLVNAVRDAESILGNCNVAVTVPGGEVKVPYALLMTKLNTMLTLNYGGKATDFHLLIEPSSPGMFH